MARNLLIFLCLLSTSLMSGQITASPDKIYIVGNTAEDMITFKFDLSNKSESESRLYWKLYKDEDFPSQWATQVCDFEFCYGDNIDQIINDVSKNVLAPDESKEFKIHLLSNGTTGTSGLMLRLFSDEELLNEVLSIPTDLIEISSTTPVFDIDRNIELKVFPNPVQNSFQITNDDKVGKIKVYKITGKEVMQFNHRPGQSHDISSLYSGIYIAKVFDQSGGILKTLRIQKK